MTDERSAGPRAVSGTVRGRVQGVGFRWFVVRAAQELGVSGFVRNRPDGAVEFVAQGERAQVERLLVRVRQGPPAARVESLEMQEVAVAPGLVGFEVLRG